MDDSFDQIVKDYDTQKIVLPPTYSDVKKLLLELKSAQLANEKELKKFDNNTDEGKTACEKACLLIERKTITEELAQVQKQYDVLESKEFLNIYWKRFEADRKFSNLTLLWRAYLLWINPCSVKFFHYYFCGFTTLCAIYMLHSKCNDIFFFLLLSIFFLGHLRVKYAEPFAILLNASGIIHGYYIMASISPLGTFFHFMLHLFHHVARVVLEFKPPQ